MTNDTNNTGTNDVQDTQCQHVDTNGVRCVLPANHEGAHRRPSSLAPFDRRCDRRWR
jgi:hypothetical protein